MIQTENSLHDFDSFAESLEIGEYYIQETEDKSNTFLKIIHEYCKNVAAFTIKLCLIQPLVPKFVLCMVQIWDHSMISFQFVFS